jgi:hypothetical protein
MLSLAVHDTDAHADAARDGREPALPTSLDELCRLAAQQMLVVALEAERRAYIDAPPRSATTMATGWWSATATTGHARSRPRPDGWR